MADFKIQIAGTVFAVTSLFESTRDYCKNYLSDRQPDYTLTVEPSDLVFEQQMLDEEAREEGMKRRKFTDPFLERTAIQRKVAERLLDRDTLLFHGSGVALDGRGYLFTARCGTGKSTHTRLWREVFGSRAQMINDDKPFLSLTGRGVTIHGAPWSGKHGLDSNVSLPLQAICILERGPENRISPICPQEALDMLLHQSCPPLAESRQEAFRALVEKLAESVPLWRMECTKDPAAALVSANAMAPKE